MKVTVQLALCFAVSGMASCASGGNKMGASMSTYDQFFSDYTAVMKRVPGAKEVQCSAFAGPPTDYRFANCFFYPASTSVAAVQQTLKENGFVLKSSAGGPSAVRVYDSKGGAYFISQAEIEAKQGSILVGSVVSDNGLYVGQRKQSDPWAELSLHQAAQRVAEHLASDSTAVVPCEPSSDQTVCITVKDRRAVLGHLADLFYAGEPANFQKKYQAGPFTYHGDEVWKPGEEGYDSVTVAFTRKTKADVFDVKDAQTYRNMRFRIELTNRAAMVTASYRPGYVPKP